jgi:hypothetical protein
MADVVVCKHVLNGAEPTILEGNPLGLACALCDECDAINRRDEPATLEEAQAVLEDSRTRFIGVPYAEAEERFNLPSCLPKQGRWKFQNGWSAESPE